MFLSPVSPGLIGAAAAVPLLAKAVIHGPSIRKKHKKSFAAFDAELDETVCDRFNNADLTLTLKVGLRQINPTGGAASGNYNDAGGTSRKIIKWTAGSWAKWKQNFQTTGQSFWHGKFWLINNHPVLEFSDNAILYRHNIYCRFRLVVADATAGSKHHHVIDVVRLDPSESFFGSHSRLYDSKDILPIRKATDSGGKAIMQRAHVHEIGHLLGLGHSAQGTAACPVTGNTNASACYGGNDTELNSVMGAGMTLMPHHAYPWRMAAASILGKGTVRKPSVNRQAATNMNALLAPLSGVIPSKTYTGADFASKDWEPKMRRHYPRTMAQVRSGLAITKRPSR